MKISFSDFWGECNIPGHGLMLGFNPNKNIFLDMVRNLRENVEVVSDDPDVLFYSCFGNEHARFRKDVVNKIFYTGENKRPDFNSCNYSLTFDYDEYDGRNIRFPLWMMQIDWFNQISYDNPQYVFPLEYVDGPNTFKNNNKDGFASSVFNNETPLRLEVCNKLNTYKPVDIYGKQTNRWSYGEYKKLENISKYKFNICFENTSYPGYNTEKLIQAKVAGCIPLYWGSQEVDLEFNKKSYVNLADFNDQESFIDYIKEIDQNDTLYKSILNESLLTNNPNITDIMNKLNKII